MNYVLLQLDQTELDLFMHMKKYRLVSKSYIDLYDTYDEEQEDDKPYIRFYTIGNIEFYIIKYEFTYKSNTTSKSNKSSKSSNTKTSNTEKSNTETTIQIITNAPVKIWEQEINKHITNEDMQDYYLEFIQLLRTNEENDFAKLYKELIQEKLNAFIWSLQIYGSILGEGTLTQEVQTRKGPEIVDAKTFLILDNERDPKKLVGQYDLDTIYQLCDRKLNIKYLLQGLEINDDDEKENKHPQGILMSVLEQKDESDNIIIRGIRLTRLQKPNPFGIYMCSSGMGTFLQKHTEELLCKMYEILYKKRDLLGKRKRRDTPTLSLSSSQVAQNPREIFYELFAIETAVGFWEKVGFVKTGETKILNKKTQFRMKKQICFV